MVRVYSIPNYVNLLGHEKNNKNNNQFGANPINPQKAKKTIENVTNDLNQEDLTNAVANALVKKREQNVHQHKILTKLGNFLYRNQGELEAQLLNAIFTTTLAPFFIAYNPLSNKDERTKKYTALRQPISAGVAIAGGIALTKPLNHYLEYLAANGFFGNNMDKSLMPTQLKFTEVETKKFETLKKTSQEFYKLLIGENPENISVVETSDGKFLVRVFKDGKNIDKEVKSITRFKTLNEAKAALNEYLANNNLHSIKMGTFLAERFNIPYDTETIKKTGKYAVENNKFLKQCKKIKAIDFLHNVGLINKEIMTSDKLVALVSELGDALEKKLNGDNSRLTLNDRKSYSRQISMRTGENSENVLLHHLLRYTELIPKIDSANKEWDNSQINDLLNKNVIEAIKTIYQRMEVAPEHLKGMVKNIETKEGLENFLKQISENHLKRINSRFGHFKKYVGIVTNLFQVMCTCTLLNYLYPKIVHKFWPHLEKDDNETPIMSPLTETPISFKGGL